MYICFILNIFFISIFLKNYRLFTKYKNYSFFFLKINSTDGYEYKIILELAGIDPKLNNLGKYGFKGRTGHILTIINIPVDIFIEKFPPLHYKNEIKRLTKELIQQIERKYHPERYEEKDTWCGKANQVRLANLIDEEKAKLKGCRYPKEAKLKSEYTPEDEIKYLKVLKNNASDNDNEEEHERLSLLVKEAKKRLSLRGGKKTRKRKTFKKYKKRCKTRKKY